MALVHHDNGINSPRNPSKTDLAHQTLIPTQRSTVFTISLKSNFTFFQNHFLLSSVKMQLTQIFTILAVAVAGVVAVPGGHPPPPPPPPSKPTSVVQQVLSLMPLYFGEF
jgi:hypothetical protein